ncbi:hypothetical protein SLAVM298S_00012 [Streptomyces lavendulae subsp. lavendulae]
MALDVADTTGAPVASVESLVLRPVSAAQLGEDRGAHHESLFGVEWAKLPLAAAPVPADERWAVLGEDQADFRIGGAPLEAHTDLTALRARIAAGRLGAGRGGSSRCPARPGPAAGRPPPAPPPTRRSPWSRSGWPRRASTPPGCS